MEKTYIFLFVANRTVSAAYSSSGKKLPLQRLRKCTTTQRATYNIADNCVKVSVNLNNYFDAEIIKLYKKTHHLTQKQYSVLLGVSESTVRSWE